MQRIEVKNFGPLKDVSIDITNIVVLIGESASGKSTLAKLVYFFNNLKDEIYRIIQDELSRKTNIGNNVITKKILLKCFIIYI
jgi:predicted ATPase